MLSYHTLWLSTIALHCVVPTGVSAIAVAPRNSQGAPLVDVYTTRHRIFNAIRATQNEGSEHKASVDLQKSFDDSILFQLQVYPYLPMQFPSNRLLHSEKTQDP